MSALQNCPRCGSPQPHLHPAVQLGGEAETCTHRFHLRETPQNVLTYRNNVLAKLELEVAEARKIAGPMLAQAMQVAA